MPDSFPVEDLFPLDDTFPGDLAEYYLSPYPDSPFSVYRDPGLQSLISQIDFTDPVFLTRIKRPGPARRNLYADGNFELDYPTLTSKIEQAPSLLAYWRLNEYTTPVYDRKSNRQGVVTGGSSVFGQQGADFLSDEDTAMGNDTVNWRINVAPSAAYNPDATFTYGLFAQVLATADPTQYVFNHYDNNDNSGVNMVYTPGSQTMNITVGYIPPPGSAQTFNVPAGANGVYHFWIITSDGTYIWVYRDGDLIVRSPLQAAFLPTTTGLTIGAEPTAGLFPFRGWIDEFFITDAFTDSAQSKDYYEQWDAANLIPSQRPWRQLRGNHRGWYSAGGVKQADTASFTFPSINFDWSAGGRRSIRLNPMSKDPTLFQVRPGFQTPYDRLEAAAVPGRNYSAGLTVKNEAAVPKSFTLSLIMGNATYATPPVTIPALGSKRLTVENKLAPWPTQQPAPIGELGDNAVPWGTSFTVPILMALDSLEHHTQFEPVSIDQVFLGEGPTADLAVEDPYNVLNQALGQGIPLWIRNETTLTFTALRLAAYPIDPDDIQPWFEATADPDADNWVPARHGPATIKGTFTPGSVTKVWVRPVTDQRPGVGVHRLALMISGD